MLDAYALGAGSPEEAAAIEEHVADCVQCWEELSKAQRTAALLSLAVPIEHASEKLGDRIIASARREMAGIREVQKQPLLRRLGFGWGAAAAGLGAASLAALTFAGLLQAQVNDLRDENSALESQLVAANESVASQLAETNRAIADQGTIISLVSGPTSTVEMGSVAENGDGSMWYTWSADQEAGLIVCADVPPPPEGKVYQIWFSANSRRLPAESFTPTDGKCSVPVTIPSGAWQPTGIGVSLEDPDAISDQPQDGWLVYAHLPEQE
jgi:hypothetical protein